MAAKDAQNRIEKKLVVLSGAGISAESGGRYLQGFRRFVGRV